MVPEYRNVFVSSAFTSKQVLFTWNFGSSKGVRFWCFMHPEDCLPLPACVTDGVPDRNSAASKLSSREFDPLQEQARLKRNHNGETLGSGSVKEEAQPEGNAGWEFLLKCVCKHWSLLTHCRLDGPLIKYPQFLDILQTWNVQPLVIFLVTVWLYRCSS